MNDALNARLETLNTYCAEVDDLIAKQDESIAKLVALSADLPNGATYDAVHAAIEAAHADRAQLIADRAEIDSMWNEALLSFERAA